MRYFYPNQKPRDVKVLDFGMGWGHYCIASNAVGFDVYGSELSDVRIKYAQNNGVKLIKNTKEMQTNPARRARRGNYDFESRRPSGD